MKDEPLSALGEALWRDFQTSILSYAIAWLNPADGMVKDLQALREIGTDVERLMRIGFDCRDLEASLHSRFIPSHATLSGDATSGDVPSEDQTSDHTTDLPEHEENPSLFPWISNVELERYLPPTDADLQPDRASERQVTNPESNRPRQNEVQATIKRGVSCRAERQGLTEEALQERHDIEADRAPVMRTGFDFTELTEALTSRFLPTDFVAPEPNPELRNEAEDRVTDRSEESSRATWEPEFYASIRGLQDFAHLLASAPDERRALWSDPDPSADSSSEREQDRLSRPIPSEDEGGNVTRLPIPNNPDDPEESIHLQMPTALTRVHPASTKDRPGNIAMPEWPIFERAGDHERAVDISEIGLEQILEALAEKIRKEYRRFYGS